MNVARIEIEGRTLRIRPHHGAWRSLKLSGRVPGHVSLRTTCFCKICRAARRRRRHN